MPQMVVRFVTRLRWSAGLLIAMMALPAVHVAAAPSTAEVEAWIGAEWDSATTLKSVANTQWVYFDEHSHVPSVVELDALRSRVRGHPDHPELPDLQTYEQRLVAGPDRVRKQLWYQGQNIWRHSSDTMMNGVLYYTDMANNGQSAWALTPGQLNVIKSTAPEPSHDYTEFRNDINLLLRRFAFGLFGDDDGMHWQRTPVNLSEDHWSFDARADGTTLRFSGTWDSEQRRGFVSRMAIVSCIRDQAFVGSYSEFLDWRTRAGIAITTRVNVYTAKLVLEQSLVLQEVSRSETGAIEKLCQPPTLDSDPVRGTLTYASMNDYRDGDEQQHARGSDGQLTPAGRSPAFDFDRRLLFAGWAILGALLVLFIALIGRRRRQDLQ